MTIDLDEVAKRMGREPVRAKAVRESAARDEDFTGLQDDITELRRRLVDAWRERDDAEALVRRLRLDLDELRTELKRKEVA